MEAHLQPDLPGQVHLKFDDHYKNDFLGVDVRLRGSASEISYLTSRFEFNSATAELHWDECDVSDASVSGIQTTKRQGIGTIFLRNTISLAVAANMNTITLAAVDEGRAFWPHNGFGFLDNENCTGSQFISRVRRNANKAFEKQFISKPQKDEVDQILDAPFDPLLSCKIANIPGHVKINSKRTMPLWVMLMRGIRGHMAVLRLKDPATQPYIASTARKADAYAAALRARWS